MSDISSALALLYKEHADQARQHENQRERATAVIVAIATAIVAVVSNSGFALRALPLAVLLIPLGAFGAMFAAKHYERNRFHSFVAGRFRDALDAELSAPANVAAPGLLGGIRGKAETDHPREYTKARARQRPPGVVGWRLNTFWINVHRSIVAVGIVLASSIIFVRWQRLCWYFERVF
jgi:hypothetical protein